MRHCIGKALQFCILRFEFLDKCLSLVQLVLQGFVQTRVLDRQANISGIKTKRFQLFAVDRPSADEIVNANGSDRLITRPGSHRSKVCYAIHFVFWRYIILNLVISCVVVAIGSFQYQSEI